MSNPLLETPCGCTRSLQPADLALNTASIQLLRSFGFRKEGHFRANVFFTWGSENGFAMLQSEWKALEIVNAGDWKKPDAIL